MTHDLILYIQRFVEYSPIELVERVAESLDASHSWNGDVQLPYVPSPRLNTLLTKMVQAANTVGYSPAGLAFSLRTACAVQAYHRRMPQIELVLSGPVFPPFEMRRTDEAIMQVIQGAQNRLTLISFALYRVDRLTQVLAEAAQRGVKIRMFIEMNKLRNSDMRTLYGEELASHMEVYVWAEARRPYSSQGKQGVLHAKATVADSEYLFISSANLTENAMSLNIELGVLIRGGEYPRKIEQIFDTYLARGLFERLSGSA